MKKASIFCVLALCLLLCTSSAFAGFEYSATPFILAKNYTYEGHYYLLSDNSTYNTGGTENENSGRTPYAVFKDGYIKTQWQGQYEFISANTSYGGIIDQIVRYPNPGKDSIILTSTWTAGPKIGQSESFKKDITIRACPYVDNVALSGEQRSCRKQTITVKIAQNPIYPIQDFSISIPGAQCKEINSYLDSNNEYLIASMDFLCKTETNKTYQYIINAIDSRGKSIQETGKFTVSKDLDPYAGIKNEGSFTYYRGEYGEAAKVYVHAIEKETDDKVSYNWTINDELGRSYELKEDEKGKFFSLPYLGEYILNLKVKDQWENTILEFITDSDYKTASTSKTIKVDNVAPIVYFDSADMKSLEAEILLLNCTEDTAALEHELRNEYNIVPIFYNAKLEDTKPGQLVQLGQFTTDFSNNLNQSKYENIAQSVYCDNQYAYRLLGDPDSSNYYYLKYCLDDLDIPAAKLNVDNLEEFENKCSSGFYQKLEDGSYPVYDYQGNINYTFKLSTTKVSTQNRTVITLTNLKTNQSVKKTSSKTSSLQVAYALELYDGQIIIGLGERNYYNPALSGTKAQTTKYTSDKFVFTDFINNNPSVNIPNIPNFEYGFRFKNTILLTYAKQQTSTTSIFQLTKGYDQTIKDLSKIYFSGNRKSIVIDCNKEPLSINLILEKLETASTSAPHSSSSTTLCFNYFDQESDPFMKLKYTYAGKTYYSDSLIIEIERVKGANTVEAWVMDDTGNTKYNKYSIKPCVVNLENLDEEDSGDEEIEEDLLSEFFKKHQLHEKDIRN